jgi:ubiquinone/menaquinone biosynthesis C-methylase UbiE
MFQTQHAVLPTATHDEFAREEFCSSLRKLFTTNLWPGCRELYEKGLLAVFRERHGRDPQSFDEVFGLLRESFYFRGTELLGRTAQEMVWDTVGESIERQLGELNAKAQARRRGGGSLRLNPALKIPRYLQAVDIHVMPGNFHRDRSEDDVFAGALYDRGVYVFSFGGLGALNDNYGHAIAEFLQERLPRFKPRRILEIGCGTGMATVPVAKAFPRAEMHAIDVGPALLRYAHARAVSLGAKVHFSQQDACSTDFPDGHFDLVYSIIVTHECPVPVLRTMLKEQNRILAPGGILLHDGYFDPPPLAPLDEVMNTWFARNANEPFSRGFRRFDFRKALVNSGFRAAALFTGTREAVYLQGHLPPVSFIGAVKDESPGVAQ